MQQESQAGLSFLCTDKRTEDSPWDLATIRASHAETVLELQKTRQLLLLEHRISRDLQVCQSTVTQCKSVHIRVKISCLNALFTCGGSTTLHVKLFNSKL